MDSNSDRGRCVTNEPQRHLRADGLVLWVPHCPHNIVTISCSVRPSSIPSVSILKIGGARRNGFEHVQMFLRDFVLSQESTIVRNKS